MGNREVMEESLTKAAFEEALIKYPESDKAIMFLYGALMPSSPVMESEKETLKATFWGEKSNSATFEQLIHSVVTTPEDVINYLQVSLDLGEEHFYVALGVLGEKYQGRPLKFEDYVGGS